MASGADKAKNLATAEALVREAAQRGAALVGLPENVAWMGPESERAAAAEPLDGPTLLRFSALARALGIHLLAGSVLETGGEGGRLYNTSVLFAPTGERLAVYRKIHLFDVEVGDGQTYRESAAVAPGKDVVCVETPLGAIGLSVCYDVRFPELYRALSGKGAVLLTVPSAFTLMTGKAYVLAPAQGGRHPGDRLTYGHACVLDPWGLVVACASEGEGLAVADMDASLLERVRARLPALGHRRLS
jgi:predicted amidohydrolase